MPRMSPSGRRSFLTGVAAGLAGLVSGGCGAPARQEPRAARKPSRPPVVLVRAGWEPDNVGDAAAAAGMLRLIGQYVPGAQTMLWSNELGQGVRDLLAKAFPGVQQVSGETGEDGTPQDEALAEAFQKADLLVHGSGPRVAARHIEAWRAATGKPYGLFGVTIPAEDEAESAGLTEGLRGTIEGAAFVFTRETKSLEVLQAAQLRGPALGFAPDAAFSVDLANAEAAEAFLARHGLERRRFLVAVPGPELAGGHARLRELVTHWVRETGGKALVAPAAANQLEMMGPLVYDPLPEEVKAKVVLRERYWLADEASSVCAQAMAMVSSDWSSPILAAVNDTPYIYLHPAGEGIKGQMWLDVGLRRWQLEAGQGDGGEAAGRLMEIHTHYPNAQVELHEAVLYARRLQSAAVQVVRGAADAAVPSAPGDV